MARSKKTVQEQVHENYPDFANTIEALSVMELEMRLSAYAKENVKVDEAKEADEELARVSALKSEFEAPYKDAKKALKLKSKYIISLIREKGGEV